MRSCSRSVAGDICSLAVLPTSNCGVRLPVLEQPPSTAATSIPATARCFFARPPRCDVTTTHPPTAVSSPGRDLDLLRPGGVDPRPASFLDPSAHPDAGAFELFRLHAGGLESRPIAPQNRDGEVTRPDPSEVYVYCPAALADRQNFALRHGESALPGRQRGEVVGSLYIISRFCPQPELPVPRISLCEEQRFGTGARPAAHLGVAGGQQVLLDPMFPTLARHESLHGKPAVTIARGFRLFEHDFPARQQFFE